MQDEQFTNTYLIIKVVIKLARSEKVLSSRAKVILLHGILTTSIIEESDALPFDIIDLVDRKATVETMREKNAALGNASCEKDSLEEHHSANGVDSLLPLESRTGTGIIGRERRNLCERRIVPSANKDGDPIQYH